ncbi:MULTISPECIES: hypothetical protein [Bacillaceae]
MFIDRAVEKVRAAVVKAAHEIGVARKELRAAVQRLSHHNLLV